MGKTIKVQIELWRLILLAGFAFIGIYWTVNKLLELLGVF